MTESAIFEPLIVSDIFLTGIAIDAGSQVVRLTGYVDLPKVSTEDAERRIVARLTMSRLAACELWGNLIKAGVGAGYDKIAEITTEIANNYARDKGLDN